MPYELVLLVSIVHRDMTGRWLYPVKSILFDDNHRI
jgi:hypothetical protein